MFLTEKEMAETVRACRYCPMCYVADRVASLVRRESYAPRGRAAILYALEQGLIQWDDAVADIMFTTLNDGLLREWCVGKYDHEEMVIQARAHLFDLGLAPEGVTRYLKDLREGRDPQKEPGEMLAARGVRVEPRAEVLLFSGCSVRGSDGATLAAMGRLFNRAGVEFMVLESEPCCGWPFYQLGDRAAAKEFSVRVAKALRESGAQTVVLLDADCYRMLLTRTARFGGDLTGIRIVHATGLLEDWIESGRIEIRERIHGPVTYQDPCALARYCEGLDAPRKVLRAVVEGELREMETHGKLAHCCGAGGMLGVHRPDLTDSVALLRLEEAHATGARTLVTACPRCDATFERAMGGEPKATIPVRNIVDLVAQAAGLGR
jgi:Fe-S oxidoreductase